MDLQQLAVLGQIVASLRLQFQAVLLMLHREDDRPIQVWSLHRHCERLLSTLLGLRRIAG